MDLKTFIKCFGVAVMTLALTNLALFALYYSGNETIVGGDMSLLVLYEVLVFFSVLLSTLIFFAISFREKKVVYTAPPPAPKKAG